MLNDQIVPFAFASKCFSKNDNHSVVTSRLDSENMSVSKIYSLILFLFYP